MITGAEVVTALVATISTVVGVVVWLVRLEGRVNLSDQRQRDFKELLNERFDSSDQRLDRIERALNGALRRGEHYEHKPRN